MTRAPAAPHPRGALLATTEDDLRAAQRAWHFIARRIDAYGLEGLYDISGLERSLEVSEDEVLFLSDEIAPALYWDRLRALALEHLGGETARHDVALTNRVTAASVAALLALAPRGGTVVGMSPTVTHPSVVRAAAVAGARFLDTSTIEGLAAALRRRRVGLVVLTRLDLAGELLPLETLRDAVALVHGRGIPVYLDDAGGARVGPAVFSQPRALELGADVAVTSLDTYGLRGPRLGLLAGDRALVSRIRSRSVECGLEARPLFYPAAARSLGRYRPERVRELVATTRFVAGSLRDRLGPLCRETPVAIRLRGEDILARAREAAGLRDVPLAPHEATAALAMLLLRDYGLLTAPLAAIPPGGPDFLIAFVPPETLARCGGAAALSRAIADSLEELARLLRDPEALRELLLGPDDARG